ncbi:hypothetical protein GGR57DRAFT_458829 [Xylariaceae sp. FL1272]|nr:hypothetical protein GGR57DRAFT_458829 [Xylariaceae sp. FL1272]
MGILLRRLSGDDEPSRLEEPPTQHIPPDPSSSGYNTTAPATNGWLVAAIVVGSLIVTTLAIFMLSHYIKSRQRKANRSRALEPMSSVAIRRHKRNRSSADRQLAEEEERNMMIRKSLANRYSLAPSAHHSRVSSLSTDYQSVVSADEEHDETAGVKQDWKEWEARLQNDRRNSSPKLDQHPAFSTRISMPEPTREPSPYRGGLPPALYTPPRHYTTTMQQQYTPLQ